jgi:hypothetical protein
MECKIQTLRYESKSQSRDMILTVCIWSHTTQRQQRLLNHQHCETQTNDATWIAEERCFNTYKLYLRVTISLAAARPPALKQTSMSALFLAPGLGTIKLCKCNI